MVNNITHPILIVDENRCKNNIKRMAKKAVSAACEFRPHFKTHQSAEIGEWFRKEGVTAITVSSVSMAEYFHHNGWNDITIAFPLYPAQLYGLIKLNKSCKLRLFVNSADDVEMLSKYLIKPFQVYIELDTGYSRSGVYHKDKNLINSIIAACDSKENVRFHGFYVHHGGTYKAINKYDIEEIIAPTLSIFKEFKSLYEGVKFSLGDTPSASVLTDFVSVDELTPGNFVFYDWMQTKIGSCSLEDVALFAMLPVAQISLNKNQAIVHGGAVHLSKDFVETNAIKNYGQVVSISSTSVNTEPIFLSSLSQEHGILEGELENIGSSVIICPIHSCLTANLHSYYTTTDGRRIEKRVLS